jgi:hypothetical protein
MNSFEDSTLNTFIIINEKDICIIIMNIYLLIVLLILVLDNCVINKLY